MLKYLIFANVKVGLFYCVTGQNLFQIHLNASGVLKIERSGTLRTSIKILPWAQTSFSSIPESCREIIDKMDKFIYIILNACEPTIHAVAIL
jgi:hypothetical protein